MLMLGRWAGFDLGHALWLYVPAAIAVPALLAVAIHFFFERPVTTALRRFAAACLGGSPKMTEAQVQPAEWKGNSPH